MSFKRINLPAIGLLVVLMTAGALLAMAAEPEPVAPVKSGKADPTVDAETQIGRSSVSDLKVNQAELDANGELRLDAKPGQPQLKPMTVEINAVLDEAHLQVATLQGRFDKEPNADVAVALVRQIEQIKINTELDILRVQLRYARTDGRDELVQELETALNLMTTPRTQKQPIDRPAPDAGNR